MDDPVVGSEGTPAPPPLPVFIQVAVTTDREERLKCFANGISDGPELAPGSGAHGVVPLPSVAGSEFNVRELAEPCLQLPPQDAQFRHMTSTDTENPLAYLDYSQLQDLIESNWAQFALALIRVGRARPRRRWSVVRRSERFLGLRAGASARSRSGASCGRQWPGQRTEYPHPAPRAHLPVPRRPLPGLVRGWRRTTSIESITLSESEGQEERAPSRLIVRSVGSNSTGALSAELAVLRSALGRPRKRQEREARKHTDGPAGTDNPGHTNCPYLVLRPVSGRLDFSAADERPVSGTRGNWLEAYRVGPCKWGCGCPCAVRLMAKRGAGLVRG